MNDNRVKCINIAFGIGCLIGMSGLYLREVGVTNVRTDIIFHMGMIIIVLSLACLFLERMITSSDGVNS